MHSFLWSEYLQNLWTSLFFYVTMAKVCKPYFRARNPWFFVLYYGEQWEMIQPNMHPASQQDREERKEQSNIQGARELNVLPDIWKKKGSLYQENWVTRVHSLPSFLKTKKKKKSRPQQLYDDDNAGIVKSTVMCSRVVPSYFEEQWIALELM